MFFNQYEVKQVKQSSYAADYKVLEDKYSAAFDQRKQKTDELIVAFDSKDESKINQAQQDLKVADKQAAADEVNAKGKEE